MQHETSCKTAGKGGREEVTRYADSRLHYPSVDELIMSLWSIFLVSISRDPQSGFLGYID